MGASLQTHYDTLGVGRQASPEQVRAAYRRRAQSCHPDKRADAADTQTAAQALMVQINQAYAVLSDPSGRATYDRWINAHEELVAAQRAVAAASRPGALSSWPWYLLSATIAFSMLTVGTVLYTELVPVVVAPPGTPHPAAATTRPTFSGDSRDTSRTLGTTASPAEPLPGRSR